MNLSLLGFVPLSDHIHYIRFHQGPPFGSLPFLIKMESQHQSCVPWWPSRFDLCCETKTRILCIVGRWFDASEIAQKLMETEDQSYTTSSHPQLPLLDFLHPQHSITISKQLGTVFRSVFPPTQDQEKGKSFAVFCYNSAKHTVNCWRMSAAIN